MSWKWYDQWDSKTGKYVDRFRSTENLEEKSGSKYFYKEVESIPSIPGRMPEPGWWVVRQKGEVETIVRFLSLDGFCRITKQGFDQLKWDSYEFIRPIDMSIPEEDEETS